VEIGTARGGSLFVWSRSNPNAELIVSIERPFRGGYDNRRAKLYTEFIVDGPRSRMALIRGNSHDEATLRQLREVLHDRLIDFLFIDGDHAYDGVRRDFEMYSPLVKPDGLIGFHDIANPKYPGVPRFWEEVRLRHRHMEIKAHGQGIGFCFGGW